MKRDTALLPADFHSSFLSSEKDCETILKKLFVTSQPFSNDLKRLLVINMPDCLDNKDNKIYQKAIDKMDLSLLKDYGYIRFTPKVSMAEHNEVKNYLIITFDDFESSTNPQFRNCTIRINILCHTDEWDLGNFRLRPLKIAGYIDGILNEAKLSGIGTLHFLGCDLVVLDQTLSGYVLSYQATHGSDDKIPIETE